MLSSDFAVSVRKHVLCCMAIFVVVTVFLSRDLGSIPLFAWDEGTFANAAQNIVYGDSWLAPTFSWPGNHNDPGPLLEKPPLAIWAQALSMHIFGVSMAAARLPSVLATATTAVVIYWFGYRVFDWRTGLASAFLLPLLPLVLFSNHGARFAVNDPLLTFFGTVFFCSVWIAKEDRRLLWLAGLAGGLGVLTKHVAMFPFAVAVSPWIAYNYRSYLNIAAIKGAAVGSLVVLPWHLYMFFTFGNNWVNEYVVEQIIGRSTGEFGITVSGALFPFMRYPYFSRLPDLYAQFWPVLVFSCIIIVVASIAKFDNHWLSKPDYVTGGVLLWWFVSFPIIYAIAGGNHVWYILPTVVPAALLISWTSAQFVNFAVHKISFPDNKCLDTGYALGGIVVIILMMAVMGLPPTDMNGNGWSADQRSYSSHLSSNDTVVVSPNATAYTDRAFALAFYTRASVSVDEPACDNGFAVVNESSQEGSVVTYGEYTNSKLINCNK